MKFGQSIEGNMTKNHTQNVVDKLVPDPFLKIKIEHISESIVSKEFYRTCFYCMASWGLSKYIEIKLQATCFYLILGFL